MSTTLVLAAALFFHEQIPLSLTLKRALYLAAIKSSVLQATLYPPNSTPFIKYANGFLSVAYALRAVELLIIHDPSRLKRLEMVSSSSSSENVYVWKTMPPALSAQRLLMVCDLLLNPRGIGWEHGSTRYLPRLQRLEPPPSHGNEIEKLEEDQEQGKFVVDHSDKESPTSFLFTEFIKLLIAWLVYDTYQTGFVRNCPRVREGLRATLNSRLLGFHISPETSEMLTRRLLLPPACWLACYAFLDGIHAVIALFAVGVLGLVAPSLAGEPWMYPPVFGSWRYMFTSRLREIWGKLWHDLCRRPLLTNSYSLVPRSFPLPLRRLAVVFISFVISGFLHAAGTFAVCRDVQAVLMMMAFFILLPLCIAIQEMVSGVVLARALPPGRMTRTIIWMLDAAYVLVWGYCTSPWFFKYSMLPEALAAIPLPRQFSLYAI